MYVCMYVCIFTVCSQTFILFCLRKTSVSVETYKLFPWIFVAFIQRPLIFALWVFPFNLRKTRDQRPLGRDPDKSWCHGHITVKLFWSQSMALWTLVAAYEHAAANPHGTMGCDQKSFIILVMWWGHQLLSRSLPNGHLSRVSQRLGWELITLPPYIIVQYQDG